jgi:hypothetical protein
VMSSMVTLRTPCLKMTPDARVKISIFFSSTARR